MNPKPGYVGLLGTMFALALGSRAEAADAVSSPTLDAIESAQRNGQISIEQALVFKLYFVKASDKLPARFQMSAPERMKCATEVLAEARSALDRLPAATQQEVRYLLARPTLNSFIDTAHFRIHYSNSGANVPYQWPSTVYRDAVMQSCEDSWTFFHVTETWLVPPSDGANGGGSNLIDCYVDDISGVYGYTEAESNPPGGFPNDATAFFVIDNDYTGFGYTDRTLPMKVTVAHEYHHVVQMGYTTANSWWMENLATFQEDEVYDSINDNYQYMSSFLSSPYRKQSYFTGSYPYGAFIWPTFLKENWSHGLVEDMQFCAATTSIFTCFDNVLAPLASSHGLAQAEWNVWNFYTRSDRDDGNHYIEGATYPATMAADRTFSTYPQVDQHPTASRQPEATGCSVLRFTPQAGSGDNKLTVSFDGPACTGQVVLIAKDTGSQTFHEYYMALDAAGNGSVDVLNWNVSDFAHLIATMPRACGNGTFDYVIDAETGTSVDVDDHTPLYTRMVVLDQNTPNPFGVDTRITYRLAVPGSVQLDVFDASGRKVRGLLRGSQAAGEFSIRWDGRDDGATRVSPGVYFYRLTRNGQAESKKMLLIAE